MPIFENEQYTAKELAKNASWKRWGARKAFLHQIHKENEEKRQAKVKAENVVFWAIGGSI